MTVVIPTTLSEALAALATMPDAHLLAGGTDLMVEVNFNRRKPTDVIALRKVEELSHWSINPDGTLLTIGAGLPYAAMEQGIIAKLVPALAQAARTVGSPQIRAVGTLGGNLGTCSPAGDGLPVLSALDAVIHLQSSSARRDLSVHDFMVGVKRTTRAAHELITGVTVPVLTGWQGYTKVGVRNAMVIAVASACLAVDTTASNVRLALGAVGPTVIRCRETEAWLATQHDISSAAQVSAALAKEFGDRAALEARPIDDHRSTAVYRRHAIAVLANRLLQRAYPA
ncbi:MAG: FAD binding domain-containing protein [Ilumatobacteraceae bacterium]